MHLGDGAITPECAALTFTAAAAGLSAAALAVRREPPARDKLMIAAGLGALVFAAQAINVPVLPGASAHLVGGVLLAWVLGPGLGSFTMATVLALQALLLGDGGLASLGANVLSMALLPSLCVAIGKRLAPAEGRSSYVALACAAALSVPLAAALIAGETSLFRNSTELIGWQAFAAQLIATHLWIGLLEGGLTLTAVWSLALVLRPNGQMVWRPALAVALLAAVLALCTPLSSELPDGYEAAAQRWTAIADSP